MKKNILFLLGILALVSLSCVKEEVSETPVAAENLISYTFVGTNTIDTKVSIGDKTNGWWPVLWNEGDKISISKKIEGEKLSDAALNDGEGTNHGTFAALSSAYNGEVVIAYPATSNYEAGVLTGTVPVEQAGLSDKVGNGGLAYAVATMTGADVPVSFSLNHLSAYVRLVLTTEEYAEYTLTGATLLCKDEDVALAGNIEFTVSDETAAYTSVSHSVKATLEAPVKFGTSQTIWFSTLPANLKGKELTVIAHMVNGNKTVTVPVTFTLPADDKYQFKAHSVNSLTVGVASSKVPLWYETEDVRDFVGGWAYGPQNTYLLQQSKNDSGYYLEVKARGDFAKVQEPKYYGMYTASAEGNFSSNASSQMLCYINDDKTNYTYDSEKLVSVSSDYKIRINLFGKDNKILHPDGTTEKKPEGRWAVVAIYNADKEVIWSYMIQRFQSGDDKPVDIDYGSFKLLDRSLGADRRYATIAEESTSAEAKKQIANCHAYFQWGRKDPFPWSDGCQENYDRAAGPVSIEQAVANPGKFYYSKTGTDWNSDNHSANLWGAESGKKTIYDPCPEGYRVPDKAVLDFMASAKTTILKSETSGTAFAGKNTVVAVDLNNDGDYDDFWPYAGYLANASTNTWGGTGVRPSSNSKHIATYWFNKADISVTDSWNAYMLLSEGEAPSIATNNRVNAYAIRCQKEE